MAIPDDDRRKRAILARLLVDILKPSCEAISATANERLIAYCVALSSFGPHPMGLNKIAETSELPRTTVRRTLTNLCKRGWAHKVDGSYVIHPAYESRAADEWRLDEKYKMIIDAAAALQNGNGKRGEGP